MVDDANGPDQPTPSELTPTDMEVAEKTVQAVGELQEAMAAALMAGLIVEPNFMQVENRLTRYGTRISSFVCNVRVYRKLT